MPSPKVARIQSRKWPLPSLLRSPLLWPLQPGNEPEPLWANNADCFGRIGDPATVFHNPAFANPLVDFLTEHGIDELVEVRIVRKDDMPAFVPHEAVAVDMRGGMSANPVRFSYRTQLS